MWVIRLLEVATIHNPIAAGVEHTLLVMNWCQLIVSFRSTLEDDYIFLAFKVVCSCSDKWRGYGSLLKVSLQANLHMTHEDQIFVANGY